MCGIGPLKHNEINVRPEVKDRDEVETRSVQGCTLSKYYKVKTYGRRWVSRSPPGHCSGRRRSWRGRSGSYRSPPSLERTWVWRWWCCRPLSSATTTTKRCTEALKCDRAIQNFWFLPSLNSDIQSPCKTYIIYRGSTRPNYALIMTFLVS